ncbi:MraY family glycosyltransferase [Latilactobacillus sakei]|uniref:Undecaprenyl/decaprenyl-phosphate alpha-N-acetylglucosaminyl 1-phosphate transferase n=1 Tax=Latilactobacillus sakei TaxID=1599 RepID=A0AAX0VDP6_LATSK|nr:MULTISPECIES: MraY family glycosyltransferase [Latilactobacillus]ASN13491.1 undecaprenyl-phosphate alpha-N-acetylglucosaminyl 1-phosphate transferase [Latilactobacillus sakei]AUX12796.1 undecaprenyl/decaprenyl-phosphate alpha-N-acetylglucosaminyl 1-phosphate transferase [Latilactobacillus sakei]KRL68889.1 tagO protein [Latilactobacillus sakei subsp. carnosus DSM 15831]MCM1570541.1 undecaprenyl/decaprenyl-phosphate alpha-N-acetylglucosaminyl 1-phosphate transferase [Latilactobacillus sakei]M
MFRIIVGLFATMLVSAAITPLVRRLAFVLGAVDKPNARRVNKKAMPSMGGLAIFIAFNVGTFILLRGQFPTHELFSIFLAECIIIITGMIDDIKELSPKEKMLGILIAGLVIYFLAGVRMNILTIPLVGTFKLGWLSFPITIFWILAITNAVNLIDGLDGLATGVSIIALFTMGVIAYFFLAITNVSVSIMIFCLVAALIGFLPHNFHPAKIFLGDTGALFIGFMIAVLSLKGLKNVTFITLLIPVIILGVPITDTVYAMLRRILNRKPISQADKHHLHHRLMQLGLSHRQTVLVIYGLALVFSLISLLYPLSTLWGSLALTIAVLFGLELFVESIGLVGENRQPLLHLLKRLLKPRDEEKD